MQKKNKTAFRINSSHSSYAPDALLPTSEIIQIAKNLGVDLGRGSSLERIRYFIKLGLLPHMVRKIPKPVTGYKLPVTSSQASPVGHLPYSCVNTLSRIDKLYKKGFTFPQIAQKLKDEKANKSTSQKTDSSPTLNRTTSNPIEKVNYGIHIFPRYGISQKELNQKLKKQQENFDQKLKQATQPASLAKRGELPNFLQGKGQTLAYDGPGSRSGLKPSSRIPEYPNTRIPIYLKAAALIIIFTSIVSVTIYSGKNYFTSIKNKQKASSEINKSSSVVGQVLAATSDTHRLYIDADTEVSGTTVFAENITAPNILYGAVAGTGIAISAGQNPTIAVDATEIVTAVNTLPGALTITGTGGTTITSTGSTITINSTSGTLTSESDTLSTVTGRGAGTSTEVSLNGGIASTGNLNIKATGFVRIGDDTLTPDVASGDDDLYVLDDLEFKGRLIAGVSGSGSAGTVNQCLLSAGASSPAVWGACTAGGAMTSFTLSADSGTDQTISDANTLEVAGGTNGIDTVAGATDTVTLNLDYTEITTATFGTGSGFTWTFDAGATDPTIALASAQITLGATTLVLSGTTTITASSLTTITGAATAIDFTEFDVSASTGAITINDTADAGNITIEGTVLDINSLDFAAAGTITTGGTTDLTLDPTDEVVLGDTDTIIIGGHAGAVAYNVISDAGGAPGNASVNSDDDLYIEGFLEVDGGLQVDGTITGSTTFNCTDCINADDLADNIDINAATETTLTFTGAAATSIIIDGTTNVNTTTAGVIDLNVASITANNVGFNVDYTMNDGVTATNDLFAAKINLNQNDVDGDLFGLVITNNATAAIVGTDDVECLLCLDNAENTAGVVTDAIRISSSGVAAGITNDIKLQNSETITNSTDGTIALGTTTLTLTGTTTITGTSLTTITGGATGIDFTEFDISASTGAITINDTADAGNITIEGTVLDINSLDFAAAGTITTGGTTDLTLDPTDEVVLGDTDTIIIGGHAGAVAYNVISDAGGAPGNASVNSDDDLYIEGFLEVDGGLQVDGTITGSTTFNCTDCINADDLADNIDLTAATETSLTFTTAASNTIVLQEPTAAVGILDVNLSSATSDVRGIDISTTFSNTAASGVAYGLYNNFAHSTALATTVSQTYFGQYNNVAKTGADTTSGTIAIYGIYSAASNTGGDTAATRNTYGGYFSATGGTSGTVNTYGIYATGGTSDNSYGLYIPDQTGGGIANYGIYVAGGNSYALYTADDDVRFTLGSADRVYIDGTTLDQSQSSGTLDIDTGNGSSIDYTVLDIAYSSEFGGGLINNYKEYGLKLVETQSTAYTASLVVGVDNVYSYGLYTNVNKTRAETCSGSCTTLQSDIYGQYTTVTNTGSATGAIIRNSYGGYFTVTGDTNGTSTAYGIYTTAASADTNYSLYTASGNVSHVLGAGEKVYIDGSTTANTTTAGVLDMDVTSLTHQNSGLNLSYTSTAAGAATTITQYGLYNSFSSTQAVTATSPIFNYYGDYTTVSKSGADSLTTGGTFNTYGLLSTVSNTSTDASAAGTRNTYGGYFSATGAAAGTTTTYGIYTTAASADTNWSLYANAGNIAALDDLFLGATTETISDSGFVLDGNGDLFVGGQLGVEDGLYLDDDIVAIGTATGGTAFNFNASTVTTGNGISLTGTGFITGELLDLNGTFSPTTGPTMEAIDINITHSPTTNADAFQSINLVTTDSTALANNVQGFQNSIILIGNAAKLAYGNYIDIASNSTTGDTLTGAYVTVSHSGITGTGNATLYGIWSRVDSSAVTDTNAATIYGGYFNALGNTGGTNSVAYGVYTAASSSDLNYGIFSASGNDILTLAAGEKVYIDATTTANTTTAGVLDLNVTSLTHQNSGLNLSYTSTAAGAATTITQYGLYNSFASTQAVTATSPTFNYYGDYTTVSKSGADSLTTGGTFNTYGLVGTSSNTSTDASAAGTRNTYGAYLSSTGAAGGTTTAYGIYATATGADTNFAAYFAGNTRVNSVLAVGENATLFNHVGIWIAPDLITLFGVSRGVIIDPTLTTNSTTNHIQLDIESTTVSGVGATPSNYGLLVRDQTIGSTADYGIYVAGADSFAIYTAGDDIEFNLAAADSVTIDASTTANTQTVGAIDLNVTSLTHQNSGLNLSYTSTAAGAATTITQYGIYNSFASTQAVTATSPAFDYYGNYTTVSKSGADSLTTGGTFNTYGLVSTSSNTSTDASAAGTRNTYAGYFTATGAAAGTTTAYGVFADATGADSNFQFYSGSAFVNTAATTALCWDNSGASGILDCSTPVGDYAEVYPTEESVDYGDIVVLGSEDVQIDHVTTSEDGTALPGISYNTKKLTKSTQAYQASVIGVVSQNWADFSSTGHGSVKEEDHPLPVALSGRVPVKVTGEGGPINVGDPLTTSSTPGVAMKADLTKGSIIGKALGGYSGSGIGNVMMFVETSTRYNLKEALAGLDLNTTTLNSSSITLSNNLNFNVDMVASDGTLKEEFKDKVLTAEQVRQLVENQVGSEISSLQAQIDTLNSQLATFDSPLPSTSDVGSNSSPSNSTSDVESIQNTSEVGSDSSDVEATDSASLANQTQQTLDAMNDLLSTIDLNIDTLTITGNTNLAQTQVAGTFSQDGTLIIDYGKQINVLGSTLYLQNDPLAGCFHTTSDVGFDSSSSTTTSDMGSDSSEVSSCYNQLLNIGAGKAVFDKNGNLIIKGSLTAQNVETKELTVNVADANSASAGSSQIPTNQHQVTIFTTAIKPNAKILITPIGPTGNKIIYIAQKVQFEGFTVAIEGGPALNTIDFDWLIINTTELSQNNQTTN